MSHNNEPPPQDLRCLQAQLFSSLVLKELNVLEPSVIALIVVLLDSLI